MPLLSTTCFKCHSQPQPQLLYRERWQKGKFSRGNQTNEIFFKKLHHSEIKGKPDMRITSETRLFQVQLPRLLPVFDGQHTSLLHTRWLVMGKARIPLQTWR